MAPTTKRKASGVNSSSLFDLKAVVAEHEDDFKKSKAAGKTTVGAAKRERNKDKKISAWARQNAGVQARAARDIVELEEVGRPTLAQARAKLERKVAAYDKLRKGMSAGMSEAQYDNLLVDFDTKIIENGYESDSDDVDESLKIPQQPGDDEDDPIIEYEDEFGRQRTARRSEVPRQLLPREHDPDADDDEAYVIHNPVGFFPTYEPTAARVEQIEKAFSDATNPLEVHYDAAAEVRAKGAGFYDFGPDEEERRRKMAALGAAREETQKMRKELGAEDAAVGLEGMRSGERAGEEGKIERSRAMEKRKRELEERRKMVEAKRRKVGAGATVGGEAGTTSQQGELKAATREPSAGPPSQTTRVKKTEPADPLGMLEAAITKGKAHPSTSALDADAFLASIEKMMNKQSAKP